MFFINNTEVDKDYIIGNSDSIEVVQLKTVHDLYRLYKMDEGIYTSFINGTAADGDSELYDGCRIDVLKREEPASQAESENVNSEKINNEKPESSIMVMVNNKAVSLPGKKDNTPYIFADMLNFTDIDPSKPKGNIILLHNGKEASYLNNISDNDEIIIKWDSEY